jgi:lipoteichoic acid synthase
MIGIRALRPRYPLNDAERLTAGWIALVLVLLGSRYSVLHLAGKAQPERAVLTQWLPFAGYQDVALVVGLAAIAEFALRRISHPRRRFCCRMCAWLICLLVAWYSSASVEIYRFLSTPLTYRLIAMSHNLRGIRSSMDAALTHERLTVVASAPIIVLVVSFILLRGGVGLVRAVRQLATRLPIRLALGGYIGVSWCVIHMSPLESSAVANPHLALLASFCDGDDPFVTGAVDESDSADFAPGVARRSGDSSAWHGRARGCNVIMFVMESVGADSIGPHGSSRDTSPELTRLAERGVTFQRIYASQPYTSNAMVGLFCSLYPWHGWRSMPRRDPDFRVPGVGNVLQDAGYRSGLLHTGDMQFDNEKRFLEQHGFGEVHDLWSLQSLLGGSYDEDDAPHATPGVHLHLPDRLLLPAATQWIDADRSRPFFLTLWTIQSHHPYFGAPSDVPFDTNDAERNRYLNAIRVADKLLGDLVRELESRGLADSTLIAVMGDHGEAFGQHAYRTHSKTIYEEELRIPLVLIAPRLTSEAVRMDMLGQQIDIAPTLLDLLGQVPPTEWQGQSLFASDRTDRAYLFTAFHQYLFGVIEGHDKYVWNASTGRGSFYDLSSDPAERSNLIRTERGAKSTELHRRLAGWVHFQNSYLAQFMSAQ